MRYYQSAFLNPVKSTISHKLSFLILSAIIFSVLVWGRSAEAFKPEWSVGDRWHVNAIYKMPQKEEAWSDPTCWEYHVSGIEPLEGQACYVLDVRDLSLRLNVKTRLWIRTGDHFLKKVLVTKQRRGKTIETTYGFDDLAPALTTGSLSPFDMPVFPIAVASTREYRIKKTLDRELKVKRTLTQIVGRGVPPTIPGLFENESTLIEVRCVDQDGNSLFTQYYDETQPWAIFGMNQNIKYWLVEK